MEFMELAKKRYSCRAFSSREVSAEQIDRILEAAIAAPTAVNTQPFHIWHFSSAEAREQIESCTPCTFGAAHFLLVGCRQQDAWVRPFDSRNFADVDGAIAATHMILAIEAEGLNTTWVGYFDAPKLKKAYPEMEDYDLIALFPVGYAAEGKEGEASEKHFIRKSKEEMVSVL